MRKLIKKCEAVSNGIVDICREIPDVDKQNATVADLFQFCVSMRKNLSLSENVRDVGAVIAGLKDALKDIRLCEFAVQSYLETELVSKELAGPVLRDCKTLRKMIGKKIESVGCGLQATNDNG